MTGQTIPRALDYEAAKQLGLIGHLRVFLDGDEVRRPVAFDQDTGAVTVHRFHENGRPLVIDGAVATEVKHGVVKVAWK